MLRIRLSRTGRKNQPKFRIVVAEALDPIKGRFVEILGHYLPISPQKELVVKKDRVSYWISCGALPTDAVASLLKRNGMADMEKYIGPRNFQRKKKKDAQAAPAAKAPNAPAAAAPVQEAPQEASTPSS